MSAINYLTLRNANWNVFGVSSIVNSTITTTTLKTTTISVTSSIVSIGQSTNAANFGQSQGSYVNTAWYSTLNATFTPTAVTKVSMVANSNYQLAINGQSTVSSIMQTQNAGQTWTSISGATGLLSATTTNYSSGAIAGNYSLLAANGGYLYLSNNNGTSYTNTNPNTPYVHFKFESNLTDTIGNSTATPTGTFIYPPGNVGSSCIYFNNATNGTLTNSLSCSLPSALSSSFTISGWFNIKSTTPPNAGIGGAQILFATTTGNVILLYLQTYNGVYSLNANIHTNVIYGTTAILPNVWYNFTLIYIPGGTSSIYINNILSGTISSTATVSSFSTFYLGSQTASSATNSYYGYLDDIKIYNNVATITPMVPANWSNVAISGNAQYMLATASNNGLFMSSNYGSTWQQISAVALQAYWTGLTLSYTGQYMLASGTIMPQLTGLSTSAASTTWTVNGVTWTATASDSYNSSFYPACAFNNVSSGNNVWAALGYDGTSGAYTSLTYSTTISGGVGAKSGAWLQIQSSVPLIMQSYSFAVENYLTCPYIYYIVGSTDGTTWYPIQLTTFSTNPFVSGNTYLGWVNPCIVNYTGTQTIVGTQTGSCTTTSYSTSTTPYTYFRLVITNTWPSSTGTAVSLGEWYINFLGGQSYSTNYGASWTNNFAVPASSALAVSASGQYSLYAVGQTAYLGSNYLVGPSYTTPTLTSINAAIVGGALSQTGQYQVIVTAGTTNNLYYSINYGATFLSISLGSSALTSCTMSYDGSYITAANATMVYTLNSNGTAYTVAVGNSAGQQNQAQNAIAIGSNAGQMNQTANSIILNASNTALNAYDPGLYVAPIATAQQSTSTSYSLLGYGASDNQVVQSGITFANQTQTVYGEWVQLQLTTATSITSYQLQPRTIYTGRYPVAWTIVGSVDGVNWLILDQQSGFTSLLWGTQFVLKNASPMYTTFRMIITQINSGLICDIGGFILYNNGTPLFTAPTNTSAVAPYTLSGTNNNILSLNSVVVCIITSSSTTYSNVFGIQNDSATVYFYPGMIAVANGYNNTANGSSQLFLGFIVAAANIGSGANCEYNSSYTAFQGTSTTVISPSVQIADLYNNIKYASTTQFALDVNGSVRAQNITFQDGTVQQSASNFQQAWSQFGQNWTKTSLPTGSWYQCALSYSGQYQLVVSNNGPSAIYMSSNYGQTWTSLASQTSSSAGWSYCNISSSGQYMSAVYQAGGTAGGFYLSSNYGQTWNYITVTTVQLDAFAMSSSGQYMTCTPSYGVASYVYISSNYGQNWVPSTLYLTTADNAFSASMSGSGQYQIVSSNTKIYLSTNYGVSWSVAATVSGNITGSAVSGNGQYMTVSGNGYINVSSNYGQSWIQTTNTGAYGIGFMSQSGQYQIVGNNSAASIYVSINYGQSFTTVTTPSGTSFFASTSGSGIYSLYGVNGGGSVYQSVIPSYQLGNVGIGTMNPGSSLSVYNNTSSGTPFLLQLYSPSMPVNNVTFIQFGQSATSYNECQMGFFYAGYNSLANYGFVQINGKGNILCWKADGNVGIGTTSIGTNISGTFGQLPIACISVPTSSGAALELNRSGAGGNYGTGIVHTLTTTGSFKGAYAYALGGSAGTIATSLQSQANGYYCIDVAKAGIFLSDQSGNTYYNASFCIYSGYAAFNSVNVGIGITNPAYALDIFGASGPGNTKCIQLRNGGDSNTIGSGFKSPQIIFSYSGGSLTFPHWISSRHESAGASGNGLDFYICNGGNNSLANTNLIMTVAGNGVGIGTTNPTANTALDVVGNARISGTLVLGHCAFLARGPTGGATSTTPPNPIVYSNTIYNIGSCWNSSTYIFTAPAQGIYQFSGTFNASAAYSSAYLNVIGTWSGTIYFTNHANGAHMPFTVQIQMSTGDTAQFRASSTTVYADQNDCISGCLLFRTG